VTNATILTSSHQTQLPAIIRQRPRGNPSAEDFKQQTENSAHQRQSRRQSDPSEEGRVGGANGKPSKRSSANVTYLRERRSPRDIHAQERRQTTDRRGFGVTSFAQRAADRAPALTTVGSGFMAQLIAQEIVPDLALQPSLMTDNGVEAYESSMSRAEQHIDPFNAYAENA
jgi:hypothetical protein